MQLPLAVHAPHAGFDPVLMHVQSRAAENNHFHKTLLSICLGDIGLRFSLPCVLPSWVQQFRVRCDVQARLWFGLHFRLHRGTAFTHAVTQHYFHLFWVGRYSHARLWLKLLLLTFP